MFNMICIKIENMPEPPPFITLTTPLIPYKCVIHCHVLSELVIILSIVGRLPA